MANLRSGLLGEIVTMSVDTLRANKMRSALTVLGVVIGIMSIVGMTSLIRGFDESLRDSIRALGPNTIMVQKFSGLTIPFSWGLDGNRPGRQPAQESHHQTAKPREAAARRRRRPRARARSG